MEKMFNSKCKTTECLKEINKGQQAAHFYKSTLSMTSVCYHLYLPIIIFLFGLISGRGKKVS